jgi:hypothetical protein
MAKHAKTLPHEAAHDDSAKPPSADRRRWLKAGLSAPPILMTVASRPVLAQTCVPPSAYVYLGASAPGMYADCNGYGPDTWLRSGSWPGSYSPDSRFNDYFTYDLDGNPKFSDVLGTANIANNADIFHRVARYVTAAWLNNASRKVPESVLKAMTIQHIWTEFARFGGSGSFSPTSGVSWSAEEIIDYLKSTMPGSP